MGTSRRSGSRAAVRALAVLVIGSGLVVGLGTPAEAKRINSTKELKKSCAKGNGTFSQVGKAAICDVSGGKTVFCSDKTKKCQVFDTIKREQSDGEEEELGVGETVITPNGVKLTTAVVPDSQTWKNRASVAVLGDVCANVGGDFVSSTDGTLGACGTPTATVLCQDSSATCAGVAREKVVRDLMAVLIDTAAACRAPASPVPSSPRPTAPSSTTTTSVPATTTTTISD